MLLYNGLSVFLFILLKSFSFLKHTTGFVAVSTSAISNRDKIRNGGASTFLQSRISLGSDEETYMKNNVGTTTATTSTANGEANTFLQSTISLSCDEETYMNVGTTVTTTSTANGIGSTSFLQPRIPLICDEESYMSAVTTSSANVNKSDEENVNSNNDDNIIIDNSNGDNSAVVDNDFDTILRTRRTINSFLPTLSDDWESTLEKAIQSAIHAPNHKRTEPWRFHLLGPETIQKVCELNASIVAEKKGEKAGKQKLDRWLQMPGWLVVTCKTDNGNTSNTNSMDDPIGIDRENYAACCCAVQNLCLSLHNSGMGTKWTTGPVNFDSRFNDIVGLKEDAEYVVGTIWFGTPEKKPNSPVKKQAIKDVLVRSS
jgi:nitroreductase